MKKVIMGLVLCAALAACGGGGSSGSTDDPAPDQGQADDSGSDFSGEYSYVGDSCTYYQPTGVRISQDGDNLSLIVTDTGNSGLMNGDIFAGEVDYDENTQRFVANFSESLGCESEFILDAQEAETVSAAVGITANIGDLLVVCEDGDSADGLCLSVFEAE